MGAIQSLPTDLKLVHSPCIYNCHRFLLFAKKKDKKKIIEENNNYIVSNFVMSEFVTLSICNTFHS